MRAQTQDVSAAHGDWLALAAQLLRVGRLHPSGQAEVSQRPILSRSVDSNPVRVDAPHRLAAGGRIERLSAAIPTHSGLAESVRLVLQVKRLFKTADT